MFVASYAGPTLVASIRNVMLVFLLIFLPSMESPTVVAVVPDTVASSAFRVRSGYQMETDATFETLL